MMHLSRERTIYFCVLPVLQAIKGQVWKKANIHRWRPVIQRGLQVAAAVTSYVYGIELKNMMERFIQQHIKDRTECFDDHFSCRRENCNRQHVWNWLKLFLLYLHVDADRLRFTTFLIRDDGQVNRALYLSKVFHVS